MRGKREMPRRRTGLGVLLAIIALCVIFATAKLSGLKENKGEEIVAAETETKGDVEEQERPVPELPAEETAEPTQPQNRFVLSFLGDCTLASSHYTGHFERVVGDDLAYPFSNVAQILLADDLTLANLECSFSEQRLESESEYAFCGSPKYAKSLVLGGVDYVSMGNNHTNDFGKTGVAHTAAVLEQEKVTGIQEGQSVCVDLQHDDGTSVRIGIFVRSMNGWTDEIRNGVKALREQDADIVIVCIHAGVERIYVPTKAQVALAHAAIDAGADLVVGTHPHILQPAEHYGNGEILYSLGNFCFGGNLSPQDRDTVIAQMILLVEEDGISWEMEYIPCSISATAKINDFRPTPYEAGTEDYERCLSKMATPWDPTTAEEAAAAKAAEEAAKAAAEAAAMQAAQQSLPAGEMSEPVPEREGETGDALLLPSVPEPEHIPSEIDESDPDN